MAKQRNNFGMEYHAGTAAEGTEPKGLNNISAAQILYRFLSAHCRAQLARQESSSFHTAQTKIGLKVPSGTELFNFVEQDKVLVFGCEVLNGEKSHFKKTPRKKSY